MACRILGRREKIVLVCELMNLLNMFCGIYVTALKEDDILEASQIIMGDPKSVDNSNWRPVQTEAPTMDAGDWRSQLPPGARQRIVNKIVETLKKYHPFPDQEGLREIKKAAVRFEEKIYAAATSQSDYLREISLKMLTMETQYQNTIANSLPSNSLGNSITPSDTGHTTNNQTASITDPHSDTDLDTGNWRSQLQPNSRQRIVNKIMETLKNHLPFPCQEGLHELEKISVRFEEKIYAAATSQSDYLRKISSKMLTMETKYQ